jgi:hypothetical protein
LSLSGFGNDRQTVRRRRGKKEIHVIWYDLQLKNLVAEGMNCLNKPLL